MLIRSYLLDSITQTDYFHLIRTRAKSRPTLVFCSTRKSTESAAKHLANESGERLLTQEQRTKLQAARASIEAVDDRGCLRESLHRGVAFHHAQLSKKDRDLVEALFTDLSLSW